MTDLDTELRELAAKAWAHGWARGRAEKLLIEAADRIEQLETAFRTARYHAPVDGTVAKIINRALGDNDE